MVLIRLVLPIYILLDVSFIDNTYEGVLFYSIPTYGQSVGISRLGEVQYIGDYNNQ